MSVSTIQEAIEDIKNGRMVILCDNEDRENEGDLTMATEKVTPEAINFMAKYGRGLICLSLTGERVEQLKIPLMVKEIPKALHLTPKRLHGPSLGHDVYFVREITPGFLNSLFCLKGLGSYGIHGS